MVGVTEGCEIQAVAGEEADEEGGPVLHPSELGLTSAVSWLMLRLARLARERLRCGHTGAAGRHDGMPTLDYETMRGTDDSSLRLF
jgi:hypothetical protein